MCLLHPDNKWSWPPDRPDRTKSTFARHAACDLEKGCPFCYGLARFFRSDATGRMVAPSTANRKSSSVCMLMPGRAVAKVIQRVVIIASLAVCACGCRSLSRTPVPQSVAIGRQLSQQGASAMDRHDWKRAESLLAKSVQANPQDAEARRNYADALAHRGALQEALAQIEEARRLTGEDPALLVRSGELSLTLGQSAIAAQRADEALRLDARFAPAWALRGRVTAANGRPREALSYYQRALGYAPNDDDVAILIAETYRQLNEPDRALLALQSLGARYSHGDEPQQLLYLQGLALGALGRHDEAAHLLAQAARRDRPTGEILYRLAEAELKAGHTTSAQLTLQQALAIEPDHAGSRMLSQRLSQTAQATTASWR